ncbi:MAG: hypothetical protein ACO2PO_22905 [Candidatus Calescibacterium sp.]
MKNIAKARYFLNSLSVYLFFVIFLSVFSVSSYSNQIYYSDEVLAYVERRPITKSLVLAFMKNFGVSDFEEALNTILDLFVILEFAERQNIKIPQEQIDSIIEKMHMKDIRDVEVDLLKSGLTLQEYRDLIKAKKIADEIFFQLVGVNFINHNELQKFFLKNKDKIQKDFERRFVLYKEGDMKNFGTLGWVRKGELSKVYEEAIFSLPSTGYSEVIGEDGKKVTFFVKEIKKEVDFSELKDDPNFRDYYIKEKYKEVFGAWVDAQKQKIFLRKKKK